MTLKKISQILCLAALQSLGLNASVSAQYKDVPPVCDGFEFIYSLGFPSIREYLQSDYELTSEHDETLKKAGRSPAEEYVRPA